MTEILNIPDNIRQRRLDKAKCVMVPPSVLQGVFIFNANCGCGAMTCRSGEKFDGLWGHYNDGSRGRKRRLSARRLSDRFVLLLLNDCSAKGALTGKVKLGAFAGLSPEGSTFRPNGSGDKDLYGKDVSTQDIVSKRAVPPPASAKQLLVTLEQKSPKRRS